MAAGVLIGVLILSLAAYLFVYFGSTSQQIHEQNEENQINEFNSKFTSYVGKDNITIYDVITVANLATENNKKYEFELSDEDMRRISALDKNESSFFLHDDYHAVEYLANLGR